MKKFEFKLQRLLDIRQKREDEEKVKLSKASGEFQKELFKKENIINNLNNLRRKISEDKNLLNLENLKNLDKFTTNTDIAIKYQDKIIEEKRKIMEEHIRLYNKLKQDKKVVEMLKDNALKKYNHELNLEEQKITDEISRDIFIKNQELKNYSENNN